MHSVSTFDQVDLSVPHLFRQMVGRMQATVGPNSLRRARLMSRVAGMIIRVLYGSTSSNSRRRTRVVSRETSLSVGIDYEDDRRP